MKITHVVGARPNFMKAAPVIEALSRRSGVSQVLVHTGQHYDVSMSEIFFEELGLPRPEMNLGVGSGSHAAQTAEVLVRMEKMLEGQKPDRVLVYGDVNSTLAAALACSKMGIPVGHVEAGLRSFDRTMPEEINRLLTDQIADLLFTPSADGDENLLREGVAREKIHLVGNVMIDTLVRLLPAAKKRWADSLFAPWRGVSYVLVTLHRPSNVDDPGMLEQVMEALQEISRGIPVLFPIHPRTLRCLEASRQASGSPHLHLMDPLGYLDFLALQSRASAVITDSGGIQEETTYLGVPCLTVRENTERPITVTLGTNTLVGRSIPRLLGEVARQINGRAKKGRVPPLWDGKAGERVAEVIALL